MRPVPLHLHAEERAFNSAPKQPRLALAAKLAVANVSGGRCPTQPLVGGGGGGEWLSPRPRADTC